MLSQSLFSAIGYLGLALFLILGIKIAIAYFKHRQNIDADDIFDRASVGIARVSLDGKIFAVNQALCQILGYSASELCQWHWNDITHSDDLESCRALIQSLLDRSIANFSQEKRYVRKDRSVVWCQVTVSAVSDRAAKLDYFMTVIIDISQKQAALLERQQIQRALEEAEARNRAIIDAIPDLMLRVRRDGSCTDFMLPKTTPPETFLRLEKHLSEVLSPALLDRQLQAIDLALTTGEVQVYEHQLKKYGKLRYEEVRISPLDREEVLILVRDISQQKAALLKRKQAEMALKEGEERFKRIVATTSDGLIIVDRNGKVRFVNPAAEVLFGRPARELLDRCLGLPCVVGENTEIYISHPILGTIVAEMQGRVIVWEGEVSHLISLRDMTERIQAKQALEESEEKYRRIVETTTEGIWLIDRDGNTSFVNAQMAQMLGYTVAEMAGKSLFDFMDADEQDLVQSYVEKPLPEIQENRDFKFRRRDGTDLWALVVTNPLFDKEGNYTGSLGMVTDISDRKRVEQALYDSEQRLHGILASIQDVVWSASAEKLQTLYMNLSAEKVFGRPAYEFYADPFLWFKIVHRDDKKMVKRNLHSLLETGTLEMEYRIVRPNGEVRWLYNRSRIASDSSGKVSRVDGIDTDITERKQAEAQLQQYAFYDRLTDLPNRSLFMDRLSHVLETNKRKPDGLFAVLFLDLDGFKIINDSLGHLVGDRLLQAFARRLETCLRPSDTLARLGGDEFTILLEDIKTVRDAIAVAQRILHHLTLPFYLDEQQVFTNTSIGIALSGLDYQTPDRILRDADTAMYRAKAKGKGCYAVFDVTMYQFALNRLQLETDLRQAINRDEFQLYYQPIVELNTSKIAGLEVLIRWQHPEKGFIAPDRFIPIAEETGLIIPIGQWVLQSACQQLQIWQQQFPLSPPLEVSVNLSSKKLKMSNFIEKIDEILALTNLPGHSLKLEITESLLMENIEVATDLFVELKQRQIQLCLDDFGTGYSSLSYLHRFPVDILKIDRSFVMSMKPNDSNFEIIRAIVTLAQTLGISVIAEGIETQPQWEQLKTLNCEQGQGYFFAKPLSKEEIERVLSNGITIASAEN